MNDPSTGRYERGLQIRKDVLGDEYVAAALSTSNAFTAPMQDLVTEYCWGEVWARPGLPRKVRSLVNLGMLTALNRPHELRTHVRGALNNGCSAEEIAEVLLQAAIYCGVPAAMDAFRSANDVIAEADDGVA